MAVNKKAAYDLYKNLIGCLTKQIIKRVTVDETLDRPVSRKDIIAQ